MPTRPKLVRATQLDAGNVALEFDQDLSQDGFDPARIEFRAGDGSGVLGNTIVDLSDEVLTVDFGSLSPAGLVPGPGEVSLIHVQGLFGTDGGLPVFPFVARPMLPKILSVTQGAAPNLFTVVWDRNATQNLIGDLVINPGGGTEYTANAVTTGDGTPTWHISSDGDVPTIPDGTWAAAYDLARSDEALATPEQSGRYTP